MYIVYGTKRTERSKGIVADYCPVCRDVRAFRLVRVGQVSHLYYISFGSGKLVGHLIECRTCGVWLSVEPTKYASVEKSSTVDLATLEHTTNPRLREENAKRLDLDVQIRRSPASLNPEVRRDLMIETFRLLNPKVDFRFSNSTQLDRPAGLGCIGTILLTIAAFWITAKITRPQSDIVLLMGFGTLGIGCLYTFVQLHFAPSRYVQSKIAPVLISSLRPLNPTQEELETILMKCKTVDMKIARQFKADKLWMELQRDQAEGLRH